MREALTAGLQELGEFVASLDWHAAPQDVRERLLLTVFDTIGVTVAGALTPEMRRLADVHAPPPGPARLIGAGRDVSVERAVWLNGTAACCLELDEGNKFARGHPAAHVFPAVLALGQERRVRGDVLCAALLAGHEVAARFGRATRLRAGVHPHGNWGATGAAAAAARLLGLDARQTAGAIDAACGLALATPFESALAGSFVRNTWIGAANRHGIEAARLAAADLASADGTAQASFGEILGDFDETDFSDGLGSRFDVTLGYFKRHASCSYTHPPADAALEIRARRPELDAAAISSIGVETHALAAPLDRVDYPTRLAAMFSIPYVTAVALATGDCSPERFDDRHRADAALRELVTRTTVSRSDELDGRLPGERAARVTVALSDGSRLSAEVSNPVGDADHQPFGPAEVRAKLESLLAPHQIDAGALWELVSELPNAGDSAAILRQLP